MKKSASTGHKRSPHRQVIDDSRPSRPVIQYLLAWTEIVRPYSSKNNRPWENRSLLPENER
jgi:hypothetical protein